MFALNSASLLAALLALACFVSAVQPYGVVLVDDEYLPEGAQPLLFNRLGRMDPSWAQMGFGKRSGEFDKRQQVTVFYMPVAHFFLHRSTHSLQMLVLLYIFLLLSGLSPRHVECAPFRSSEANRSDLTSSPSSLLEANRADLTSSPSSLLEAKSRKQLVREELERLYVKMKEYVERRVEKRIVPFAVGGAAAIIAALGSSGAAAGAGAGLASGIAIGGAKAGLIGAGLLIGGVAAGVGGTLIVEIINEDPHMNSIKKLCANRQEK
ncbi:hypothetical protein QR680_004667 [Steinernema hermaphroditum]|uniref:Glycine zipper domain-containing protein n=1 Tax=Steinernema hermaphroditum TaxID=289476 RepID=A0AA39LUC4_9BILA|nr:hypothetical protein QR680_004667 [Steinernema hermaphroditum]